MFRFNLRLLVALITFGIGVLFVSFGIIENSVKTPFQELPFQPSNQTESQESTEITLERTACFGDCPDYKLTISGDGTIVFEGRKFVKTNGIVKSKIDSEKIQQIINEFEKAKYFSLNDKYVNEGDGCPEVWTDSPTARTSIKINGKTKSIIHYYGCQEKEFVYPQALTKLESKIDEIVSTKQWVK